MKTPFAVYVEAETVDRLREKAASAGVPLGALADLLWRYGLERVSDEALQRWAAAQPNARGRLGGGPTKNERLALTALATLVATGEGSWRFSHAAIATKAGLRPVEGYNALQALQARGLVRGIEDPTQGHDRWDRPLVSYWHRPEDDPQANRGVAKPQ